MSEPARADLPLEEAAKKLCLWIRHTVPTWTSEVDRYLEATEAALAHRPASEPEPCCPNWYKGCKCPECAARAGVSPAPAQGSPAPCDCGDRSRKGVLHRIDGPCATVKQYRTRLTRDAAVGSPDVPYHEPCGSQACTIPGVHCACHSVHPPDRYEAMAREIMAIAFIDNWSACPPPDKPCGECRTCRIAALLRSVAQEAAQEAEERYDVLRDQARG